MQILQTASFAKTVKKLHKNQNQALNKVIENLETNPLMGTPKKGDLSGVFVYKFSMVNQQVLLAYQFDAEIQSILLLALGAHENFYRDIK